MRSCAAPSTSSHLPRCSTSLEDQLCSSDLTIFDAARPAKHFAPLATRLGLGRHSLVRPFAARITPTRTRSSSSPANPIHRRPSYQFRNTYIDLVVETSLRLSNTYTLPATDVPHKPHAMSYNNRLPAKFDPTPKKHHGWTFLIFLCGILLPPIGEGRSEICKHVHSETDPSCYTLRTRSGRRSIRNRVRLFPQLFPMHMRM